MPGHDDKFIALAGPRIRSPWRTTSPSYRTADHLPDRHVAQITEQDVDAAAVLTQQLRHEWRSVVPWPVVRPDPVLRLRWLAPLSVIGVGALILFGAPAWLVIAAGALDLIFVMRTLGSRRRAIALAARALYDKLESSAPVGTMHDEIVTLLQLDPDHDAARLLLAQEMLLEGTPLDALLQLAPLRDRHPDEGLVVFIAALAYARLGAHGDAARMLSAIRIDPYHPWNERIRLLERQCQKASSAGARVSSGEDEEDPHSLT